MSTTIPTPEPAAVIGSDYAIFWAGSGPIAPICERTGATVGSQLITTTQAEAYADARVREALEIAATAPLSRIAQMENEGYSDSWPDSFETLQFFAEGVSNRIRALIPK